MGIFGHYVLAVWVGNFDGHGNTAFVGRRAAAPLFFRIVNAIRSEQQNFSVPKHIPPLSLEPVEVCAISGQLPTRYCKHKKSTWFIPGVSPIDKCQIHRPVYIETKTGLRACNNRVKDTTEKVYEFWSSDLLNIFKKAGIPRRVPPPYHPDCNINQISQQGKKPMITSPRTKLSYQFRPDKKQKIPFMAVSDGDVKKLYWFIDERFIGTSKPGKTLFWPAKPGQYLVRVIDDQGRGDGRSLYVVTELR